MTALAKRAVACKRWRWMPGMAYIAESVNGHHSQRGRVHQQLNEYPSPCNDQWVPRPDLDDPATLGCLLALVREAWGLPGIYVQFRGGMSASVHAWLVVGPEDPDGKGGKVHITGATEAEALVAALEAAP